MQGCNSDQVCYQYACNHAHLRTCLSVRGRDCEAINEVPAHQLCGLVLHAGRVRTAYSPTNRLLCWTLGWIPDRHCRRDWDHSQWPIRFFTVLSSLIFLDALQWSATVFPILASIPVHRFAAALAFQNFLRTFAQVRNLIPGFHF